MTFKNLNTPEREVIATARLKSVGTRKASIHFTRRPDRLFAYAIAAEGQLLATGICNENECEATLKAAREQYSDTEVRFE